MQVAAQLGTRAQFSRVGNQEERGVERLNLAPRDRERYSHCKDDREGLPEEEEGGVSGEEVVVVAGGAAGGGGAGLGVEVASTSGAEAAETRRTLLTRSVSRDTGGGPDRGMDEWTGGWMGLKQIKRQMRKAKDING